MISLASTKKWPYHVSSGGLVFRKTSKLEVLLLFRNNQDGSKSYHLPKGTVEKTETLEDTAMREIYEEAGVKSRILGYLGTLYDEFENIDGRYMKKTTHYYLAEFTEASKSVDSEHDGREWLSVENAHGKLAGPTANQAQIIERALKFLEIQGAHE